MAKHPDYVLRKNARRGAITTWCPVCKKKSALSHLIGDGWSGMWRKCRYCGNVEKRLIGDRKKLYESWIKEKENEPRNGLAD